MEEMNTNSIESINSIWFVYYLGDDSEMEEGYRYFWSRPLCTPEDLMQFIRDCLYGGEEPESDMYAYDEYMEALTESKKEPFDFDRTLFGMADELNDADCQISRTYTLSDLMIYDDELFDEVRKAYRGNDDNSPVDELEEATPFLRFIQKSYCQPK